VLRGVAVGLWRNPLVLGLAVGLAASLLGLRLPQPLERTVGLLAQSSAALSLFVIGGSLAGLRLAVPQHVVLDDMDATVGAAFERAVAKLRKAGARVTDLPLPEFAELGRLHASGTLAGAEAWAWHRALIAQQGDAYDPRVRTRIEAGGRMGAADYIDLLAARQRWVAQVQARIAPFDALLMPTVPQVAPPIAELERDDARYAEANLLMLRNPTLINFLDGCALSLPCHCPCEAPVGLMLAAAGGADARLLALGLAVEALWRNPTET